MFEQDIHVNQFMLGYAEELMKEIPDERLAEQPLPGVNHPAWIIGHLALTGDFAVKLLGGEQTLPKSWILQFGPKSTPSTERDIYPTKEELLNQLMERFELARQLAVSPDPEAMSRPNPRPHMVKRLPTVADLVSFLLTGHLALHLGQLSVWRRMIGKSPLF
jgi:hypothetical protein